MRDGLAALGVWGLRFERVTDDPSVVGGMTTHVVDIDGESDDAVKGFIKLVKSLLVLWTDLVSGMVFLNSNKISRRFLGRDANIDITAFVYKAPWYIA